jgi:Raf kinase inhibitor-like YbhB/YbcL family protein
MFTLGSPAFEQGSSIPVRHTCDGEDLSPALHWSDPPAGTQSFVLVVDDPDAPDPAAPKRTWIHWVRYNIPSDVQELAEGAGNEPASEGSRDALNDSNEPGWSGPCPPIGRHRYFFRLFALDRPIEDLGTSARRADVEKVMAGHVLGSAVLMGTYASLARREAKR